MMIGIENHLTPGRKVRQFSGKKKVWIFRAVVFWKREFGILKFIISKRKLQILQVKTAKSDDFIRFHIWKLPTLKKSTGRKKQTFFLPIFVVRRTFRPGVISWIHSTRSQWRFGHIWRSELIFLQNVSELAFCLS